MTATAFTSRTVKIEFLARKQFAVVRAVEILHQVAEGDEKVPVGAAARPGHQRISLKLGQQLGIQVPVVRAITPLASPLVPVNLPRIMHQHEFVPSNLTTQDDRVDHLRCKEIVPRPALLDIARLRGRSAAWIVQGIRIDGLLFLRLNQHNRVILELLLEHNPRLVVRDGVVALRFVFQVDRLDTAACEM